MDLKTKGAMKKLVGFSNFYVIMTSIPQVLRYIQLKNTLLVLVVFAYSLQSNGQVGIGTQTPHSSAILDLTSTEKGLLIPRLNAAQRNAIANPANGLLVYDTEEEKLFFFDGVQWNELGKIGPQGPQGIAGPKGDQGDPGASGSDGANGTNGTNGADGADGISITSVVDNGNGTFTVNYSDGGDDTFSVPAGGGSGWQLDGNAGTNPTTEFIGTTDAQDLVFKTQNIERFRLKSGPATTGGFMGINTNNPTARLDVLGGASSNSNFGFRVRNAVRTNFAVRDDGIVGIQENLGIGTLTPTANLHMSKGGSARMLIDATSGANTRSLLIQNNFTGAASFAISNASQYFVFQTFNNTSFGERLRFTSSGELILGDNPPGGLAPFGSNLLTVYGDLYASGNITAGGTVTSSDGRFKKNVVSMNQGLDVIMGLRPVSYQWKKEYTDHRGMDENTKYFGFISQEVEKVFPETVIQRKIKVGTEEVEDFRFINLTNFTPMLVNAIQDQQKIIAKQANEIGELKKHISELERKLNQKLMSYNHSNQEKIATMAKELNVIKAYIEGLGTEKNKEEISSEK